MTIKAVLRDGRIHPLEPLPPDWTDGQELVVKEPELRKIPAEEHDRLKQALKENERESKEAVRREWERDGSQPLPRLEKFLRDSAAEGDEPLDPSRL